MTQHAMSPGKRTRRGFRPGREGYLLVEAIVYIAVLAVILSVGFGAFYQALDHHRALRRVADDIASALTVGERWRADVRQAIGSPQALDEGGRVGLRIPRKSGTVSYWLRDGVVWRSSTDTTNAVRLLERVKNSEMRKDPRAKVTAWVWEIELESKRKPSRTHPLFSFLAVPTDLPPP